MSGTKPQQSKEKWGGDYVTVAERIEKFYSLHPEGGINTQIIEHDPERGFILMRAEVFRNTDDAQPAGTGHAYELKSEGYVQTTSYIEVCETSSVGRALAMIGLEVKRGIASREEFEKADRMNRGQQQDAQPIPLRSPAASDQRCEQTASQPEQPRAKRESVSGSQPQGNDDFILDGQVYAITNIGKQKKFDVHAHAMTTYGKPVTAITGTQAAEMIRFLNGVKTQ